MMNTDWKTRLNCSADLSHMTLERALVSNNGARIEIRLLSDILCDEEPYLDIKQAFQQAFPDAQVSLRVASPGLAESFRENPDSFAPFITKLLSRNNPGARPILSQCMFTCDDEGVSIIAESEANRDILRQLAIDRRMSALLYDVFRINMQTHLLERGAIDEQVSRLESLKSQLTEQVDPSPVREKPVNPDIIMGVRIAAEPIPLSGISEASEKVTIRGDVLTVEFRELRGGESHLVTFLLADDTGAVTCKLFLGGRGKRAENEAGGNGGGSLSKDDKRRLDILRSGITQGAYLTVRGSPQPDSYTGDFSIKPTDINRAQRIYREDTADEKRVELHLHTAMSGLDGLTEAHVLIEQAAKWGHPAIAITDHGVTQAFPEAFAAAKKHNIKLIPGMEGYLSDEADVVTNPTDAPFTSEIIVLDFETTGLSAARERIIEIGAVRITNGLVADTYSKMVNPEKPIPAAASRINKITDDMVSGAPRFAELADDFLEFLGDTPIAAHNAPFDSAFLKAELKRIGKEYDPVVIDTLAFSRKIFPALKSHSLSSLTKHLRITLKGAHRAVNDAQATAKALIMLMEMARKQGARTIADLNYLSGDPALGANHHISILVKNQMGMTNLNRLISLAHLKHFFVGRPHIPRLKLIKHREGLLLGSACSAGEIFKAILEGEDDAQLTERAKFYDYLEIMPTDVNTYLIADGKVRSFTDIENINKRIIAIGDRLNIPVVATGDVHYLSPSDGKFRAILMSIKGYGDSEAQAPLHFRTTDEMLDAFQYLGKAKAHEVVIDNPRKIMGLIGDIRLFPAHPDGAQTFQPVWEDAADNIRNMSLAEAKRRYGDPLPGIIQARLDKELGAIIGYGFATLYDIAQKLVQRSLADGYPVGSRGSVGSSFVATMCGITEVNPLPPHYICENCRHGEFDADKIAPTGVDLPEKACPDCGTLMKRDGYSIPFEVFLGFKGDKVPDIDLNFSGEYQPRAHKTVEELFGSGNVFRAGTIGTLAEKTALAGVNKYAEAQGLNLTQAQKLRLALGCVGVKRTTGQHPGGMVILPKDYEIYQFTAVQHPADDSSSDIITTHYDFASMHDILVKLDILGHDDPTMLKTLEGMTGVPWLNIPLNDPATLSLFTSPDALGVAAKELGAMTGTFGIPEFGTRFVRQMLEETKPTTMDELVRISGLSHGTDVWTGNAQSLIKSGVAKLSECICTREDIMNMLISNGVDTKTAFDTMESVRKGKGLTEAMEKAMSAANVPAWIVDSCRKIKYMFPKGHAVAYVTMALRIGWYKVHRPLAYYAAYFTIRAVGFDASIMTLPIQNIRETIASLYDRFRELTMKERDQISMLELALEMNLRGITFAPIDLYKSAAEKFLVTDDRRIIPPFTALAGLGLSAAESIVKAREGMEFISMEDFRDRTRASTVVMDLLRTHGCFSSLPETSQVSFF
ncbi:DNA polymerase III PolC-type [Clostridia bacterium]|nr:DNA polymerase III PolC-type [Clostridia bacterium]